MAFSYTTPEDTVVGNTRLKGGTYTNTSGSTGGAIVTGLGHIVSHNAQSDAGTDAVQAAKTGGTLTVTTAADDTGNWSAQGYGGG